MSDENPCVGLPLRAFATALRWYDKAHPEVEYVDAVDWEQVRDIADDVLGRKLRSERRGKRKKGSDAGQG
jgi:hypothetical protein